MRALFRLLSAYSYIVVKVWITVCPRLGKELLTEHLIRSLCITTHLSIFFLTSVFDFIY